MIEHFADFNLMVKLFILKIIKKIKDERIQRLLRQSWSVSWPMTLIMFFVFLIGLADVYVAGRISKEIQAAYGFSSQLYFIFNIIAFALTVGSVAVASQLFSSGNRKDFIACVDTSLSVALIIGFLLSVTGFFIAGFLIYNLNVPEALKAQSTELIRIYSFGLTFAYLMFNTNGILRASERVRKSLVTMAVVCVLNVILNFTLAFRTPLGFRGIAVATVISAMVGCCMNLFFLRPLKSGYFKFSFAAIKKIINIGWPAGVLQVLWQLAAMILFLILAALPKNNIEIMAAFTNGLKIESAIFLPAFAFNLANAVVVGNLLGKKNKDDAFSIGLITASMGVVIVIFLTSIVMLNAWFISSLLSPNAMVVGECVRYIRIALLFEPLMCWSVILAGALNGSGDTKGVMKIVAGSVWLVRVPCSYIFALKLGFGPVGVWWSMNLSLFVQALLMSRRYFKRKWLRHPVH